MTPDYRIRFPSSLIDFNSEVYGGSSDGQDINNFPEPGQARYDWMRMVIIGLLANQSSVEEPINYKIGSLWMNLNDKFFKYFDGTTFADLAKAIKIDNTTLDDWSKIIDNSIGKVTEEATFSGVIDKTNITEISIPTSALIVASYHNNHPVLYLNGLMIDPRLTTFNIDRNKILLLNNEFGKIEVRKNDKYTVVIQRLDIVVPDTIVAI